MLRACAAPVLVPLAPPTMDAPAAALAIGPPQPEPEPELPEPELPEPEPELPQLHPQPEPQPQLEPEPQPEEDPEPVASAEQPAITPELAPALPGHLAHHLVLPAPAALAFARSNFTVFHSAVRGILSVAGTHYLGAQEQLCAAGGGWVAEHAVFLAAALRAHDRARPPAVGEACEAQYADGYWYAAALRGWGPGGAPLVTFDDFDEDEDHSCVAVRAARPAAAALAPGLAAHLRALVRPTRIKF